MDLDAKHAVLANAQAYRADSLAEVAGIDSYTLMENAGQGIAEAIIEEIDPCRVAVLAGPGNNGGDGFIAARHLKTLGFEVEVFLLGRISGLNGDAVGPMDLDAKHAVLANAQAYRADSLAEVAGIDSYTLMENAGQGIAEAIIEGAWHEEDRRKSTTYSAPR